MQSGVSHPFVTEGSSVISTKRPRARMWRLKFCIVRQAKDSPENYWYRQYQEELDAERLLKEYLPQVDRGRNRSNQMKIPIFSGIRFSALFGYCPVKASGGGRNSANLQVFKLASNGPRAYLSH